MGEFYTFMIVFWSIGYGFLYSVAENISNRIGSPHKITAFALFVFLCGCFIALFKSKQANLWRIKLPSTKKWIPTLPLLILPIANMCLLFFSPQKNGIPLNSWYLLTVIFTAISEELLFRGYLLNWLSRFFRNNILPVAIINSVLFGGFHFLNMISGGDFYITLLQAICALSIGFAFVFITVETDSILPCMVFHCLINASSVFEKEIVMNPETMVVYIVYITVSACYSIFGITLYCKSYASKRSKRRKRNETLH